MAGNVGGVFIIGGAAFLIIMGIRGSQHRLFPGLFGDTATMGVNVSTGEAIQQAISAVVTQTGKCYKLPNPDGTCPSGTSKTTTGAGKILCHIDGCQ